MKKNFYYFKTKYLFHPKKYGKYETKRREKHLKSYKTTPVTLIGGLYKNHFVLYAKLVELYMKKN